MSACEATGVELHRVLAVLLSAAITGTSGSCRRAEPEAGAGMQPALPPSAVASATSSSLPLTVASVPSSDELAVRAFIGLASQVELQQLVRSPKPRFGEGFLARRHVHAPSDADTSEVAQWLRSSGTDPAAAYVRLVGLVWETLRREWPEGPQLDESDELVNTIPIRFASLRGRPGSDVVAAINQQIVTAGYPKSRLKVVAGEAADGGTCANRIMDPEPDTYPERVPSPETTMSLRTALGREWIYLDANTIKLGCPPSWLLGPVRTVEVPFAMGVDKISVDIRRGDSLAGTRTDCFESSWELSGQPVRIGQSLLLSKAALGPSGGALLEQLVLHRTADGSWTYRLRACNERDRDEGDALRATGVFGVKAYTVSVPADAVLRSTAWSGTTGEPPLAVDAAMDLALSRAHSKLSATAVVTAIELRRVYDNRWIYFSWAQDGLPLAREYAGMPFGVTLSREVFQPQD